MLTSNLELLPLFSFSELYLLVSTLGSAQGHPRDIVPSLCSVFGRGIDAANGRTPFDRFRPPQVAEIREHPAGDRQRPAGHLASSPRRIDVSERFLVHYAS